MCLGCGLLWPAKALGLIYPGGPQPPMGDDAYIRIPFPVLSGGRGVDETRPSRATKGARESQDLRIDPRGGLFEARAGPQRVLYLPSCVDVMISIFQYFNFYYANFQASVDSRIDGFVFSATAKNL